MLKNIISLLLMSLLVSCASTSHKNEILSSLRTDGIYVSKDTNKDGTKIKLKFYMKKENGEEKMKVIVTGLNSAIPELVTESKYDTWFIIPSDRNAIQYRITKGNMGVSMKHDLLDYNFIKK